MVQPGQRQPPEGGDARIAVRTGLIRLGSEHHKLVPLLHQRTDESACGDYGAVERVIPGVKNDSNFEWHGAPLSLRKFRLFDRSMLRR